MEQKKLDAIIEHIAKQCHTSVQEVREQMLLAMEEGQQNRDPVVQARWAKIPRQGGSPTIEELVSYLAHLETDQTAP